MKVAIAGATGYVGAELVRLLVRHPQVDIVALSSQSHAGKPYASVYGHMRKIVELDCAEDDLNALHQQAGVLFLALPHGIASEKVTDKVLEKTKVIDLGADFRIKSQSEYEHWYKVPHHSPQLLPKAVYGLCEWTRKSVRKTNLVANPGCYTTASLLTLLPLMKEGLLEPDSIIIDAKSGVSGAGRGVNLGTHYVEVNESVKAYNLAHHRHTPEIEEQVKLLAGVDTHLTFTPHLIPMSRGILSTNYGRLAKPVTDNDVAAIYHEYYHYEPFIRILPVGTYPETRFVKGSNYCDIGFKVDTRTGRLIALGAIDNLVKGAAGQAIQNMNILCDWSETLGLEQVPMFPG